MSNAKPPKAVHLKCSYEESKPSKQEEHLKIRFIIKKYIRDLTRFSILHDTLSLLKSDLRFQSEIYHKVTLITLWI